MLINQDNCMIDVLDVEGKGLLHATCGKSCQSYCYKTLKMWYSTKNGRIEIIGILLDKSSDVNVLNNEGQSVLHAACVCGHTEIVDILLRSNSNVNQCDKAKKTPLFIACENGYTDIVRLLIESKCEIFNHSLNGQTVLHAVCSGRDKSNRNYLVYRRTRYYRHKWRLSYMRFIEGHKDILTLLIDKKCDVDILDNNSQTSLHIACYKGNVALVEILLRNKCECDVNISDNNSQTPLHIACYKGNVALVEILLRNKCVVDQCDNLNKTPLNLAVEGGHTKVVTMLLSRK
jgi:serine/threonine-protein phosphatase 6 regulatory ankyrin repeat subunit B